jgi:hypothetical protein
MHYISLVHFVTLDQISEFYIVVPHNALVVRPSEGGEQATARNSGLQVGIMNVLRTLEEEGRGATRGRDPYVIYMYKREREYITKRGALHGMHRECVNGIYTINVQWVS